MIWKRWAKRSWSSSEEGGVVISQADGCRRREKESRISEERRATVISMLAGAAGIFVWIYFDGQADIDKADEKEEAGEDEEDEAERTHIVRLPI